MWSARARRSALSPCRATAVALPARLLPLHQCGKPNHTRDRGCPTGAVSHHSRLPIQTSDIFPSDLPAPPHRRPVARPRPCDGQCGCAADSDRIRGRVNGDARRGTAADCLDRSRSRCPRVRDSQEQPLLRIMSTHSVVSPSPPAGSSRDPSVVSRKVLVWTSDDGTTSDLEARLKEWKRYGWSVRTRVHRMVEGPEHAVLIVLERAPHEQRQAERRSRNGSRTFPRRARRRTDPSR